MGPVIDICARRRRQGRMVCSVEITASENLRILHYLESAQNQRLRRWRRFLEVHYVCVAVVDKWPVMMTNVSRLVRVEFNRQQLVAVELDL